MLIGNIIDDIGSLASQFKDPRAQEVAKEIYEMIAEESSGDGGGGGGGGGTPFQIADLLPYIKTVRFVRKHPWVVPVGGLLAVTGLFSIGYTIARKKTCPAR